ncbi:unnamed protein product [Cylicostephanus goldi]|uniref:Uncharacterized protein n=1 Tax=Cylicostephanus goldi TaxID=71465 RepID=A0A3P7MS76_CYLGO|nr:unnamed protein product [Cylicostephanus goldi]
MQLLQSAFVLLCPVMLLRASTGQKQDVSAVAQGQNVTAIRVPATEQQNSSAIEHGDDVVPQSFQNLIGGIGQTIMGALGLGIQLDKLSNQLKQSKQPQPQQQRQQPQQPQNQLLAGLFPQQQPQQPQHQLIPGLF